MQFLAKHLVLLATIAVLTACGGGSSDKSDVTADDNSAMDGTGEPDSVACADGAVCDDGDPCTFDDKCVSGVCSGTDAADKCVSSDCTIVACDGKGGCLAPEVKEGWCLIDSECFEAEAHNPENDCKVCRPTDTSDSWTVLMDGTPCSDGQACTENDTCVAGACKGGSDGSCDDGFECTTDSCDPESGCTHEVDDSKCDDNNDCTVDACVIAMGCQNVASDTEICGDGSVCTLNDHCESGECVSDGQVECEDNNPCTSEFCHESYGCIFEFNEDPCDDSQSCTDNDVCHFGRCLGTDTWLMCPSCTIDFGPHVQKLITLRFGSGGTPGEALNVDNDVKTCSPQGSCSNGLDNMLSMAGEFVNDVIENNLSDADAGMIILTVLENPSFDGGTFTTSLLYGGLDPSNETCDFQHEICTYRTGYMNFDPFCKPFVALTNSKIVDGVLTAGGSGYVFPYKMYFVGDIEVEVVLYNARVEATVTKNGDQITHLDGVLAGAVTPEDLTALVEAIPTQFFPGGNKDGILTLVSMLPKDIDVDGDGTTDSFSIGLVFSTIPGVLLPFQYL